MWCVCCRQVHKRFARLESHVVTLARSVAHLSSEMRGYSSICQDLEEVKRDMRRLKEVTAATRGPVDAARQQHVTEWEKFRGWVPSLTNPKRVNKLTR